MLNLLGIEYLTGCMKAAFCAREKEEAYRIYMSDILYRMSCFIHMPPKMRYYDILHPSPEDDDTRSGDEIAIDRLESFGIKVVG